MADVFSRQQRSAIMARVKGKDTGPEKTVRSALHRLGYRFRLHRKDLPGKPDIVLARRRAVIFVHGCFWHGHPNCPRAARPAANAAYWNAKIDANIARDRRARNRLRRLGWRVMVVWECRIRKNLDARLRRFLDE